MLEHAIVFMIGATWALVACALFKYVFSEPKSWVYTNTQQEYKAPSKPIFKPKKQEETEEERRYNTILDNIDSYDGTGKNQKKVR